MHKLQNNTEYMKAGLTKLLNEYTYLKEKLETEDTIVGLYSSPKWPSVNGPKNSLLSCNCTAPFMAYSKTKGLKKSNWASAYLNKMSFITI